jgi:hypothetical protein
MVRLSLPQHTKQIVGLIVFLTAFFFAFASGIGAQTKGHHCVGQASTLPLETQVGEPPTSACFDTIEEAWAWASHQ